MKSSAEVMIVGAGPVGLMLACELQRRQVDCLLIERRPEPSYFCKALGVTPRTLEILEDLGVVDQAIDAGVWLEGVTSLVNGQVVKTEPVALDGMPYGFLALPQYDVEGILTACLLRHGGAVRRGVTLHSFTETGDGVETVVSDAAGTPAMVACRYLVGCDGAHSTVRKGLGLAFEGDQSPMTFMLGDVELAWDLPRGPSYRCSQEVDGQLANFLVCVPVHGSPSRYRLSMAAPDRFWTHGANLDDAPTLGLLAEAAAPMLPPGTRLGTLRWSSFYRIGHRIVPRYGSGRVFIAGDAAHIHPPIGGQGMNTGLQDAHNLAWKLALAVQGRAAPDLLSSYSAERRPVGLDVVTRTGKAMDAVIANAPAGRTGAGRSLRESQLLIHYRDSRWVGEAISTAGALARGPRPGDRAPDVSGLGRRSVARPVRLKELLRGGGHTLLISADAGADPAAYGYFAALADELRARLGDAIAAYIILAPDADPVDLERVPLVIDAAGEFRRTYDTAGSPLYLIRPDGHVGYRSDLAAFSPLESHLGRIFAAA